MKKRISRFKWVLIPLVALLGFILSRPQPQAPAEIVLEQSAKATTPVAATPSQGIARPPAAAAPVNAGDGLSLQQWLAPYQTKRGLSVRKSPTGDITTISGFAYPTTWSSSEDGLSFARNLAEKIGVPAEQVQIASGNPPSTEYANQYKYSQVYKGLQVFSSYLQLTQNNKTGEVFTVSNELKNLGAPNLKVGIGNDMSIF